ncbi:MAG: LysE family translocator [Nitratireductor sp.]
MAYDEAASFFLTMLAISLAPGPVALLLVVKSASKDVFGAVGFGFGFAIGGLIIVGIVSLGLGAWFHSFRQFFEYSKYLMMGYLAWLAIAIWRGGYDVSQGQNQKKSGKLGAICSGVFTCFLSPYMIVLFPLVLPEIMDVSRFELKQFVSVSVVTFLGIAVGSAVLILFAAQINRIVKSPNSMQKLNRVLSITLMFGGGWMVLS